MGNTVTMKFADGRYTFGFDLDEIEELQRKSNAGFGTIIERVMDGNWYFSDIYETIRLGLIGSGEVPPTKAKDLCDFYVNPTKKPLAIPGDPSSPLAVARVILGSVMFGVDTSEKDDAKSGEDQAGEEMVDSSMSRPSEPQPSDPGLTPDP